MTTVASGVARFGTRAVPPADQRSFKITGTGLGGRYQTRNTGDDSNLDQEARRLAEITLKRNWDREGAPAIPLIEWNRMVAFVRLVQVHRPTILAMLSPCGDGSTHARWSLDKARWVEAEQRGGQYAVTWRNAGDVAVSEGLNETGAQNFVAGLLKRL